VSAREFLKTVTDFELMVFPGGQIWVLSPVPGGLEWRKLQSEEEVQSVARDYGWEDPE
jgi:hypothetical protein